MAFVSQAAVFDGTARQIALREFPTPKPQRCEALVRVLGCTICGSDLHTFEGRRTVPVPTVLGHEIVGEIVDFGDAHPHTDFTGQPLQQGSRVTWAIVASCGECYLCRRGLPQKCLHAVKYGHEALQPGRELLGGLAEHCLLVPGTAIVQLPDELPLSVACPASCATATIAAAMEASGDVRDRCVVVIGAGMLGLTACAMARVAGAREVLAVDLKEARRRQAERFGATRTTPPGEMANVIRELTSGHGADVILELSGSSTAMETAWPCARLGGTFVLIGAVFPGPPMSWPMEQIVRRNLTLRGVHNYAPQHLGQAVRFLEEHQSQFPFAELVSEWRPLSEIETAFSHAGNSSCLRIGVGTDS